MIRRWYLRPRWLAGHGLAAGLVILFVVLGLWQLDRHAQRQEFNDAVAAGLASEPRSLAEALDAAGGDVDALAYQRVAVDGRYIVGEELLLTPRTRDGKAGHHVLTPLRTPDGQALLVDRGWVPFELDTPPVQEAAPPSGEVSVAGLLWPAEGATRFGVDAPPAGDPVRFASTVDIARLSGQISAPLVPAYLVLEEQQPATAGALPASARPPELDDGPHLSYAVQWFLFASVGMVGYPLLLRHTARRSSAEAAQAPRRAAMKERTPSTR